MRIRLLLLIFFMAWARSIYAQDPPCANSFSALQAKGKKVQEEQVAINFVSEMLHRFDAIFPTIGYANYEEFELALRKSQIPEVQKALEYLDSAQLEIVIRQPEQGREWTPVSGFQNQYITGTSKGYKGKDRVVAEAVLTGHIIEEYETLADSLKPKYGSLQISKKQRHVRNSQSSSLGRYGNDLYTLKADAIKDRTSIFIGDSFEHIRFIAKAQGEDWRKGITGGTWESRFIPWNRRLLMVPYMLETFKMREPLFQFPVLSKGVVKIEDRFKRQYPYWEAQIFGPVDLDMVESFEFRGSPPEGQFLLELKKRKIKIYNGYDMPSKIWKPERDSK